MEFRSLTGSRIYGCDDCLAVCPWNKFAAASREARLSARAASVSPRLSDLAALDDAAFRTLFARSPIKRIGRDRFVRNVLYAVGNSADVGLVETAERLLDDPSPLVSDAAAWALSQLSEERLYPPSPSGEGDTTPTLSPARSPDPRPVPGPRPEA